MRTTKVLIRLRSLISTFLISAFIVRCLDSIIPLLAKAKITRPQLVAVAEQAGLSLAWLQTQKTGFLVTKLN